MAKIDVVCRCCNSEKVIKAGKRRLKSKPYSTPNSQTIFSAI